VVNFFPIFVSWTLQIQYFAPFSISKNNILNFPPKEYSDLLDKAVTSSNRVDRMVLLAAFVVSSYASCNARAGHKPFNPLLGKNSFLALKDYAVF